MSDLLAWTAKRRTNRLLQDALQYVDHGWPIARLAIQRGGLCTCGLLDCVDPHLPIAHPPVLTSAAAVETAFASGRWAIALLTWHFDVLELPAHLGAPLHYQLKTQCPTALAPATRRWRFFISPGSVSQDRIEVAGGRVIGGSSGWVIAPGTYTEAMGRTRWLTAPYVTHWQTYKRQDSIDAVFGTRDWSTPDAPTAQVPGLIDDVLR